MPLAGCVLGEQLGLVVEHQQVDLFEVEHLVFDKTSRRRYMAARTWDPLTALAVFVVMDPSAMWAQGGTPMLDKCTRHARHWEFGGAVVLSMSAVSHPDPGVPDDSGPDWPHDDAVLLGCTSPEATCGGPVITAWPKRQEFAARGQQITTLLDTAGVEQWYLERTEPKS